MAIGPVMLIALCIIVPTALVALVLMLLYSGLRKSHRARSLSREESEMLKEICGMLDRMDERLTNLETIVLSQGQ